ncbi:sodium:proton antiporter [Oscillatoria sp. HE19RPO]|uniref:cation:proton antiporter n=1 Tax=Oscillatoria sp. HE19RPO TaxID=2954806 RepID=UPI0020C4FA95|nr:sodium:proton antiporter [Oscillatoria sp. HE19RPO]
MIDIYILDMLALGLLLLSVTVFSGWIKRLPLSYALIYLAVGILIGPYGLKLVVVRPDANFLERLTELVVIISLFSGGLKMNRPLKFWAWQTTARLIGFLMPISIVGIALVGHWFLDLDWGAAILLGAILAPTDPVLASEVQLAHVEDKDELRFGLTSEGGLNDALAFPFVYFGLYALKDSNWNNWIYDWLVIDLIWALAAGIGMGIVVASAIVWVETQLHRVRPVDELMQDFIALSTILLAYSLTEVINGYGFVAVFVAGMTVRRSYSRDSQRTESQLRLTERVEKLLEVGTILLLGSLLRIEPSLKFAGDTLIVAGFLLFIIRPLGTWISTIGANFHTSKRLLMGWFGIRGVGSVYYLTYAMGKGLQGETGEKIAWIVFLTLVISAIVHGITATPLMNWYESKLEKRKVTLRGDRP